MLRKSAWKCEKERWRKPTHSVEWPQQPRKGWCPSTPMWKLSSGGSHWAQLTRLQIPRETRAQRHLTSSAKGQLDPVRSWHSKDHSWKERSLFRAETQLCIFQDPPGELWSIRGPNWSEEAMESTSHGNSCTKRLENYCLLKAWKTTFPDSGLCLIEWQ